MSTFVEDYEPTILDTFTQEMSMLDPSDGMQRDVTLNLKDVGAKVLKDSMLNEQDVLIMCYDVSNAESFYSLSKMFQVNMQHEFETSTKRPVIVVGCKSDLKEEREVDF